MTAEAMWILTDVSPYASGPAGVHAVLPQAARALAELATMAGLEPRRLGSVAELDPEELDRGGVLALFTIGETPYSDAQKAAIVEHWRAGKVGVFGVHSCTDASHTWPEYGDVLGARFAGHPWTRDFALDVVDRAHPATAHLGPTWDVHDELYLFSELRPEARVLLRVAPGQVDPAESPVPTGDFPLAWSLAVGRGRTFYSALGHFPAAWEHPAYLRYLAGGLAWLRSTAD